MKQQITVTRLNKHFNHIIFLVLMELATVPYEPHNKFSSITMVSNLLSSKCIMPTYHHSLYGLPISSYTQCNFFNYITDHM